MAQPRSTRRGFTLIDVLGAIVIVGTAIAATMNWMAAGTKANGQTGQASVALVLANNVHDYALTLDPGKPTTAWTTGSPIAYVLDLDGQTFATPITSHGDAFDSTTVQKMSGWSVTTAIISCRVSDLSQTYDFAHTVATDMRRLTVTVKYQSKAVYSAVWMLSPSSPPPT